MDDLRYSLPEPEAQPWLDAEPEKPLNRRSILRKVAAGSLVGVGAGFEVLWPSVAHARFSTGTADKGWGAVKGRIVWPNDLPQPKPREIEFAKYGIQGNDLKWFTSKGPVYAEDWVVNPKNSGIRWVFAWLVPLSTDAKAKLSIHPSLEKPADDTLTMEQPCSGFAPHAVAIRQGQKLVVKNDSPVNHSFQWTGMLQTGNQAMAPGTTITVGDLLAHKQPLKVSCAPHPWEGAWMRVFDHPYFTVTDPDGNFEIKMAPEGEHRLMIWHETAGWLGGNAGRNGEKIAVASGEVLDLGQLGLKPRTT